MRGGLEFTRSCDGLAYAPWRGTHVPEERTMEHLMLNISVVVAFLVVVRTGLRVVDRF
jgi:hypothetical protein